MLRANVAFSKISALVCDHLHTHLKKKKKGGCIDTAVLASCVFTLSCCHNTFIQHPPNLSTHTLDEGILRKAACKTVNDVFFAEQSLMLKLTQKAWL